MGTNVNTPFFQVPAPELPVPEYKVETLYSGTELGNDISGTQCLNTAPFCAGAQAPSVNTALDPDYLFLLLLSEFFSYTLRTYMYMEYFISDSSSQVHTNLQSTCVFSESFRSFAFVNDNLGTNMQWK